MENSIENVLLVVVDALRTDRVGAYSNSQLTPNIDTIADDGEVFDQCYSCVNATDSSLTTIFTGLYPTRHGILNHGTNVTDKEQEYVSGTTPLPELISNTHQTLGIDNLERWHKRGFDTYKNPKRKQRNFLINSLSNIVSSLPPSINNNILNIYDRISNGEVNQTSSEVISDIAVDFISKNSGPFFLFTHYWDTHIPYIKEEYHPEFITQRSYNDQRSLQEILAPIEGSQWSNRLQDGLTGESRTVSDLLRKYDAGVWKADQQVGHLVEKLKQEGVYDQTAIIITSDHGESFTEHGIIFDHHGLYDPTIHVPLIIRAPGFEGREEQFVQHFDLVPTILDLLDKPYRREQFDGVSLKPDDEERELGRDAIYAEEGHTARKRAIRTESYKYIKRLDDRTECRYCETRHAADKELYDLTKDSEESQNIEAEHPELRDELDARLEAWINELPNPVRNDVSFEVSEEVEDHLEEMGYL